MEKQNLRHTIDINGRALLLVLVWSSHSYLVMTPPLLILETQRSGVHLGLQMLDRALRGGGCASRHGDGLRLAGALDQVAALEQLVGAEALVRELGALQQQRRGASHFDTCVTREPACTSAVAPYAHALSSPVPDSLTVVLPTAT
ncbi:hypothetical protein, partial [Bosea sp. (in: a-proteobacteria)]|uniref:hypothetical protein n=1 Tax=Bosea sp. (in: a-proteobacteria) TaxID=1871050 RepID=UPI0040347E82